ncbi:MAG: 2TM domain-containing protein [Cellvibrionaceae bacterium]
MVVRKLRLKKGWSQEQLAQLSGLNIRTIQRIERGNQASLESLKSLAAVFEVDIHELTAEAKMGTSDEISMEEQRVIEHVRDLKAFYQHVISYLCTIGFLFILNLITSPDNFWVIWAAMGWGIGVVAHGFSVYEAFDFFGPDWEKKQVEKRLRRKL